MGDVFSLGSIALHVPTTASLFQSFPLAQCCLWKVLLIETWSTAPLKLFCFCTVSDSLVLCIVHHLRALSIMSILVLNFCPTHWVGKKTYSTDHLICLGKEGGAVIFHGGQGEGVEGKRQRYVSFRAPSVFWDSWDLAVLADDFKPWTHGCHWMQPLVWTLLLGRLWWAVNKTLLKNLHGSCWLSLHNPKLCTSKTQKL